VKLLGAFGIAQQGADVVVAAPGQGSAEIHRSNREGRRDPVRSLLRERRTQVLIDQRLERQAAAPRFGLQPGGDVIVQGQCRAHIKMLPRPDQDVDLFVVGRRGRSRGD
jgi:hypothetical protein